MRDRKYKLAAYCFVFLFTAMVVSSFSVTTVSENTTMSASWDQNANSIVDDFESELAGVEGNKRVSVLVTTSGSIEDLLPALGATVRYRYDAIGALSVELPAKNVKILGSAADVIRISDAKTKVQATLDSGLPVVQVPEAYNSYSYRGEGMVISVLDTGIDNSHVDLDDDDAYNDYKVVAFKDIINGQDDLSAPVSAYDDNGHGTHCASIAAGTGEGDSRYRGVAYAAQLVGVKVLDSDGGGTLEGLLAGMQWVIDNNDVYGINIASMSLSTNPSSSSDGSGEVCQMADAMMSDDIALFIAAGNHGTPPQLYGYNTIGCPSASEYAITVGSVDDDGSHSSFSNEGPTADGRIKPEICAAGNSITAAEANSGSGYVTYSGTSMATPMAAGIGALIRQADTSLTSFDVKNVLKTTALDKGETGADNTYGWGIAQAKDALDYVTGGSTDNPPSASIAAPTDGETVSGTYRIKVSASDDNGVSTVEINIDSGSWIDITNNVDSDGYYYYDWDTTAYADGSHTVNARVTDTASQTASDSVGVTVDNSGSTDDPPTCSIAAPADGETVSGTYRILVSASDDNSVSTVEISIDSGTWIDISDNVDSNGYYYYDWDTTGYADGSHTIDARATDSAGQTASDSVGVTVDNSGSGDATMHVADITYSTKSRGPHTWLTIEVAIVDSNGDPVSSADVTIDVEYPDGSVSTYTATTGSDGIAVFELKKVPSGEYTVTVTDVTHTNYTYDATANVVTSKTFSI